MDTQKRKLQKRHAERLTVLGNNIYNTVFLGIMVTPITVLTQQLFSEKPISVLDLLDIFDNKFDSLFLILLVVSLFLMLGTYFHKAADKIFMKLDQDT